MVTVQEVREVALRLPRTTEHLIYDRVKFRVGQIVYVAFSRDETVMGFGFPKEEREALVASQPKVFHLPKATDMRFRWVQAWLSELDHRRMEELVIDAWRMVVPKRVAAAHVAGLPDADPPTSRPVRAAG
ncbi:MmcQ/YjbR family DNA-binding protein [Actinoplanes sp. NPDC004185]